MISRKSVQESDVTTILRSSKDQFSELCSLANTDFRLSLANRVQNRTTIELKNGLEGNYQYSPNISRHKISSKDWIVTFTIFDYEKMGIQMPHQITLNGSGYYASTTKNGLVLFEHNSPEKPFTLNIDIPEEEYFQKSLLHCIPERDMILDIIDAGSQIDTTHGINLRIHPLGSIPTNINLYLDDMINYIKSLR